MNERKVFPILKYILYSYIPKLEESIDEMKYSGILEELEAMGEVQESSRETEVKKYPQCSID